MSQKCGSASENREDFNLFNKQPSKPDKNSCLLNKFNPDSKYACRWSNKHVQHKVKRLKTRKERGQMRAVGKESLKAKTHHHSCHHRSSKHTAHVNVCCHTNCHCPSRMKTQFPSVVPAAQEPSIITDSRLIGHHGLFNHEVKSFDIERLLSEQKKRGQSGEHNNKKKREISHLSSADMKTSFFSDGSLAPNPESSLIKTVEGATKTQDDDDCQRKKKRSLQFRTERTDNTPGQSTAETFNSVFTSKPGAFTPVTTTSLKSKSVPLDESQLTPVVDRQGVETLNLNSKRHVTSTQTPKTLLPPVPQTQACDPSPSHLNPPSSNVQHKEQDPDSVSTSIRSLAARLCDALQFSRRHTKNLVSETRAVLLKALQRQHGPWLKENLLELHPRLNFGAEPTEAVQHRDRDVVMGEEEDDDVLTSDMSFKTPERRQSFWKASPKSQQTLKQVKPPEWLTTPTDPSPHLLDGTLVSSPFVIDFGPSRSSTSDFFAPPPTLQRNKNAPQSTHWQEIFNRPKRKDSFNFDYFEDNFENRAEDVMTQSSFGPPSLDSNTRPPFPHQANLPHRYSLEPMHFPQEQDPFQTNICPFAPCFSAQTHPPLQSSQARYFNQLGHTATHPPFRSHHSDMMHFPPSHELERAASPLPSFPSPEHWSFPPMRLY